MLRKRFRDRRTEWRNDGMTDGRTAPKPISPFHFVAGDNKTSWRERTETKCNIYQMTTWMNHINHTWITYLNKSYFFQNNFKIFSKSHNDQQYAMFYFWLAYPCMFQRCCIVSVMFKYIFLQFSYVNIQFFVILQKNRCHFLHYWLATWKICFFFILTT